MSLRDIQKPRRIVRLYHGSDKLNINKFDISYSRHSFLDFGRGIYFTTNEEQAMLWSIRSNNIGAVYTIELDTSELNIKQYLTYSNDFIHTFCLCRAGFEDVVTDIQNIDAVYGYVIDNDKAAITKHTNDYYLGKANATQVRANIKVFEAKDQFCIKNQKVLDSLSIKSIRLTERVFGYSKTDWRAVKWKR